jgi:serine acetyltransferase
MKFFEKKRFPNGKREIYIVGYKVITYWIDKLKRVKRNCDIPLDYAKKLIREKNVQFIHPVGIVMSDLDEVGYNCKIYQNVSIGNKDGGCPTLEDNVTVHANSIVVGKIRIGKNSIIGCGSVVLHDIPANEVWAGNPAHFIRKIPVENIVEHQS